MNIMDITWNIVEWWHKNEPNPLKIIVLYLIAQMINVLTSTLKSVILVKGSKRVATLASTLNYVINALVVALITKMENIPIVLIITAVTNLVGVWWGLTILDKLRKDRLWRISATVKSGDWEQLKLDLKQHGIKFIRFETDWEKIELIDVFSHSREESVLIGNIFSKYKVKYTIYSNNYSL